MRLFCIFISSVMFIGCLPKGKEVQLVKTADIVLIDSFFPGDHFSNMGEFESSYPFYYIGPKHDSIIISWPYEQNDKRRMQQFKEPFYQYCSRQYNDKTIRLFVDTSIKTTASVKFYANDFRSLDSINNYHAYLISMENISDSAIFLRNGFYFNALAREAKNRKGEWVKLHEKWYETGACGTGQPRVILEPGEIILSKLKRYGGTFYTQFRLVYGTEGNEVYSNIFMDFIDEEIILRKMKSRFSE